MVSERLGHSSVAFTLDTYAHVMPPGMQPDAAELFIRLVFNGGNQKDDRAGEAPTETSEEEPDETPEEES